MPNPPKPTAMRVLHGNPGKRPLNRNEPAFRGRPKCPSWLNADAKREWTRITKEMEHIDLIKATDMAALSAYCQAYARWIAAERLIEEQGQMIDEAVFDRSGSITGYRRKKNPAVGIAKDAQAAMLAAGRLFGLSPSSRSTIAVPVPEPDPLADLDDDALLDVPIH